MNVYEQQKNRRSTEFEALKLRKCWLDSLQLVAWMEFWRKEHSITHVMGCSVWKLICTYFPFAQIWPNYAYIFVSESLFNADKESELICNVNYFLASWKETYSEWVLWLGTLDTSRPRTFENSHQSTDDFFQILETAYSVSPHSEPLKLWNVRSGYCSIDW